MQLDKQPVANYTLKQLQATLDTGTYQSLVELRVISEQGEEQTFTLARDKAPTINIDVTYDQNYVYLDINYFSSKVDSQIKNWMENLPDETKTLPIIIDVQWVKGGSIKATSRTTKLFLAADKSTVRLIGRNDELITHYVSKQDGVYANREKIILVNHRTQSSAEMFAAAMQDQKDTTIYGSQTYGKGTVQTFYDLEDGSGLLITTKQMITPKGTKIHKQGIKPDYPYLELIKH